MKKVLLASVAVLAIAGSTAVYAQHRGHGPWHHHSRMAPEDRAAFLDARIAAVHAGLKLNPDQDKLWPPLEAAVRDMVKLRIDRANARMQDRDSRDDRGPDARPARDTDPVARLRQRAETMGDNAAALKKIADTADPLYKTLDDSQKRRLAVLTRMEDRFDPGRAFGSETRRLRDEDGAGGARGPRHDGPDREFQGDRRRDRDGGPERL